ncbi:alpha/beta fold hydrolase [Sutcliffiella horikoshii]|uniref:alpha/beta hydrolase family protein n=1 Tax=Sutcliffiella horikoshii TaxID=79883 RepID=UPI00385041EB
MRNHLNLTWNEINLSVSVDYPPSYFSDKKAIFPVVIICHGFIGSKVGVNRLFVKTCDALTEVGYVVIRFDYAGCGESEGDYGSNTFDCFIEQTRAVLRFAKTLRRVDPHSITFVGHSLGGAVATLASLKEPDVKRLILWSAVGNPSKDICEIIQKSGNNLHEYEGYFLSDAFIASLANYQPIELCPFFSGDVLIIHGEDDEDIHVQYATEYANAFTTRTNGSCQLHTIQHATHTYSSTTTFHQLMSITQDWLIGVEGGLRGQAR